MPARGCWPRKRPASLVAGCRQPGTGTLWCYHHDAGLHDCNPQASRDTRGLRLAGILRGDLAHQQVPRLLSVLDRYDTLRPACGASALGGIPSHSTASRLLRGADQPAGWHPAPQPLNAEAPAANSQFNASRWQALPVPGAQVWTTTPRSGTFAAPYGPDSTWSRAPTPQSVAGIVVASCTRASRSCARFGGELVASRAPFSGVLGGGPGNGPAAASVGARLRPACARIHATRTALRGHCKALSVHVRAVLQFRL